MEIPTKQELIKKTRQYERGDNSCNSLSESTVLHDVRIDIDVAAEGQQL
mgnify:CR=1 FL=1